MQSSPAKCGRESNQTGYSALISDLDGAVKQVPVQLAGPAGNDILLAGGLSAGQTIVTAGVNLLKPGQKVNILGDDPAIKAELARTDEKPDLEPATPPNADITSQAASINLLSSANAGAAK